VIAKRHWITVISGDRHCLFSPANAKAANQNTLIWDFQVTLKHDKDSPMYSIRIRDHIMIAHSLPDPFFGPASQLHGATYVVDAEFFSPVLNAHNVVMDIGFAHEVLKETLSPLNYQDLDLLPQFSSVLTTTEYLARYIHEQVANRVQGVFAGTLRITLGESHVAWASYSAEVPRPSRP
jgi:6-pyruvoyl-tetrahydropterin synthase